MRFMFLTIVMSVLVFLTSFFISYNYADTFDYTVRPSALKENIKRR